MLKLIYVFISSHIPSQVEWAISVVNYCNKEKKLAMSLF